jgi:phage terminase small subunit
MAKLENEMMELFCQEYLATNFNGAEAARKAGSNAASPSQIAYGWMQLPEVKNRIAELMEMRTEKAGISAAYVLNRLVEIDKMDFLDIMKDDISGFKPLNEWPKIWRQYISAIDLAEIHEGYGDDRVMVGLLKKIKWPDKTKNLELLGKHVDVQAFRERVTHDGKLSQNLDDAGLQIVSDKVAELFRQGATVTH